MGIGVTPMTLQVVSNQSRPLLLTIVMVMGITKTSHIPTVAWHSIARHIPQQEYHLHHSLAHPYGSQSFSSRSFLPRLSPIIITISDHSAVPPRYSVKK